jgi:hypothetical protein
MTRNGKIARLPPAIREESNQRQKEFTPDEKQERIKQILRTD